jgi:hypothetical protein
MQFAAISLKVYSMSILLQLKNVLIDAGTYFEHGEVIRCKIKLE